MTRKLTLCPHCFCMTWSVRKGRCKWVCGKCGGDKSQSDYYWDEMERRNKE